MKADSGKQPEKESYKSKREMVLWDGGIYFGGLMASLMFGVDLYRHTENYMPSRQPASLVLFSWGWMLVVNPIVWFGFGCLFGLIRWSMQDTIRSKSGNRKE